MDDTIAFSIASIVRLSPRLVKLVKLIAASRTMAGEPLFSTTQEFDCGFRRLALT
jgi:hypothetical protein